MSFTLSDTTQSKIDALNEKVNTLCGYKANDITRNLQVLNQTGSVTVGWRQACGSKDMTHKVFEIWIKAVKELKKAGIVLNEERLKVDNRSPTAAGGFWCEIKYTL